MNLFDIIGHPETARVLVLLSAAYGAIFGSFLNMAIYRIPRRISIWKKTRSFCPSCNATIRWYHNIPIISYLALRGRCGYCKKPIPVRYLIVEILATASSALIAHYTLELNPSALGWMGYFILLIVWLVALAIVFIDFETYLIPDSLSHLLLLTALASAVLVPDLRCCADNWLDLPKRPAIGAIPAERWNALIDAGLGLVIGALLIWTLGAIGALWKRVEAMGEGDIVLMAAFGALLGWKLAVATIVMASILGAVFGLFGMLVAKLRTGQTAKTIAFEDTLDNLHRPELPHIALIRGLGETAFGILLTVAGGVGFLFVRARLGDPLPFGEVIDGYSIVMLIPPFLLTVIGGFMTLFGVIKTRRMAANDWIKTDVETTDDGAVREKLTGNYIPFGPALATAALILSIWGAPVAELGAQHYLKRNVLKPLRVPFMADRNRRLPIRRSPPVRFNPPQRANDSRRIGNPANGSN